MSDNLTINIEKIKKEKDGLDVLNDIYVYAVLGERASKEDLIRFQWYGIYQQENSKDLFKLSIPLALGKINVAQLKTLSFISKEYGKNSLDLKIGQKVQLKNLKLRDLPHVFNLLHNVDLSTIFEAGHTVRNIITCPLNSVDYLQLADVSDIADKMNEAFIGNKKFSNLPNKLQMSISGCKEGCALEELADVSFDANRFSNKIVYSIKIVGKHIGYITSSQVLTTAKEIAKLFRDFGNRDSYEKSTFNELVNTWGLKKFTDILDSSLNIKIKNLSLEENDEVTKGEHFGINKSTIDGQSYVGCVVESLNFDSNKFDSLANLLEKHKATTIKLTNQGNIIVLDVPTNTAPSLANDLEKLNLKPF
jgi:sulfite reductase beta subunit-like hemoprotein